MSTLWGIVLKLLLLIYMYIKMYYTTGISHICAGYFTGCRSVKIAPTADYHIRMAQEHLRTIPSRFRGFINPQRSIGYLYNPPGKCARNVPPPKYIQMARGRHSSPGWYPGWKRSPYSDLVYKTSLESTQKPSIGILDQPETEGRRRSRCIFCIFYGLISGPKIVTLQESSLIYI